MPFYGYHPDFKNRVAKECDRLGQQFFIPGTLPGMNEIIDAKSARRKIRGRHGRVFYISKYDDLKKTVEKRIRLCIRQARIRPMERIDLEFTWIEPHRRRDKPNITGGGMKFIFDALVGEGVIANDGWRHVANWRNEFRVEKDCPGVLVVIQSARG